jgi:hypothetical protein
MNSLSIKGIDSLSINKREVVFCNFLSFKYNSWLFHFFIYSLSKNHSIDIVAFPNAEHDMILLSVQSAEVMLFIKYDIVGIH